MAESRPRARHRASVLAVALCAVLGIGASAPLPDDSVYQLESKWTRADGTGMGLAALRGKVRVVAIFFTNCEYACPIIVGRMKTLQSSLPEDVREQVGFVLVSMDPERDDPERLRAYAERMGLQGDWTLLHGADGDVRELAALLGVRYRQEQTGGFAHSNVTTVLDRDGRVARQNLGIEGDAAEAIAAVTAAVAGEPAEKKP